MMLILIIEGVVLGTLILLSAFFSSSEVACFSLDPHQVDRIKDTHPHAGERISRLLQRPTTLLSTILIGNTIVNIGVSVIGFRLISACSPDYGQGLSILIITLGLLIFGEFGPKRIAMLWPEQVSRVYAPFLAGSVRVLKPLRIGLEQITESLSEFFTLGGEALTEDEYASAVDISGESGVLEEEEHSMLQAVMGLAKRHASDVMTPRVDMLGIDLEDDQSVWRLAEKSRVRYLVLYREEYDDIVGLLDVRAYLLNKKDDLKEATIPAYFIPEQATLDKALTQFLAKQIRVAVVVDEYGGTAGIITRGDILEEITGELGDEYHDAQVFEQLTPNAWLLDGALNIEEVNKRLGLRLNAENADRLAGWVAEKAERLPRPGEIIEADGIKAMVRQMRRNRIVLILVERLEAAE